MGLVRMPVISPIFFFKDQVCVVMNQSFLLGVVGVGVRH